MAVVAAVIAAGAALRLLNLEHNPPGLWQDEASTGVDAYLLWTTGRDRAGDYLPIISRSFGDYPLALYRYLTAPIVGLFGLTIAHQRWVAALSGISLLITTYYLARQTLGARAAVGALLSGALAPTWLHFSRYGSEAMLLPATLMAGVALFELAKARRRWWILWVGAAMLGSSAYTYHAVKLFLPLWMVPFLWYQWPLARALWRENRKHVVGPALVFVASVLPSIIMALTPEGMARGKTVAAWEHHTGWDVARVIFNNYLSYFEPRMLFLQGGPAVAQSIPGLGIWSLIDLPLMIVGGLVIARGFSQRRVYGFLVAWFFLGPIPGGITYEAHNIGRVIGWLPTPQLISGIGTAAILAWVLEQWRSRQLLATALGFLVAMGLVAGWTTTAILTTRLTLVRYPAITERDWQFEVSRSILCAKEKRAGRHIVVSPSFSAAEVFALFHLSDLPKGSWSVGSRAQLTKDEIYAAPAQEARPADSKLLCEIKQRNNKETRSVVLMLAAPEVGPPDARPPEARPAPGPSAPIMAK